MPDYAEHRIESPSFNLSSKVQNHVQCVYFYEKPAIYSFMKLSRHEFMGAPKKAVTLIGMSGVGKSYLSGILSKEDWQDYSCDYLIGAKYLAEALGGEAANMSQDNILGLSEFVGQVGDEVKGGLPLAEFQKRQKMYKEAELQSLIDACADIESSRGDFILDTTGSVCELQAPDVLEQLGQRSLFVYLKVRQEGHAEILRRAVEYPKPLYYAPDFLLERLEAYKEQFDVEDVAHIEPVAFLQWVFPFLFEARLAKYQALADQYGVTIYSDQFADVKNSDDIMRVIEGALN